MAAAIVVLSFISIFIIAITIITVVVYIIGIVSDIVIAFSLSLLWSSKSPSLLLSMLLFSQF